MKSVNVDGVDHAIVRRGTNKKKHLSGVYFGTDTIDGKLHAVVWAKFKTNQLEVFHADGPHETERDAQNACKRLANEWRGGLLQLGAKERWF